tara:strand:+ start:360 stop:1004 length:645 start_codon:yes stop_codon:yes gene_type:complete
MSEQNKIITNDLKNTDLKNFFLNNKKSIIILAAIILLTVFAYFFYSDYEKNQKVQISEQYSLAIIKYNKNNPNPSIYEMKNIINYKDPTYSPLALYFLLDNNLLTSKSEVNQYFDILINDVNLDKEVMNLIIFKKGLYNSDSASEEELLKIFYPLINSENLWKSHALYIMAEYFFSKNEMLKSKEFFEKILKTENSNPQIKLEAQKRLQRDFSV